MDHLFLLSKTMIRNLFTCFLATLIMFSCKENNETRKPLSVTPIDTSKIDYNSERIQNWKTLKFGMFIHWGVYSIPAGVWKGDKIEKLGEQIMRHAHIPVNEYEEIAKQFNPVDFDADAISNFNGYLRLFRVLLAQRAWLAIAMIV